MPLSRKHLQTVTKHWEFSELIGPERVSKGLEIVADEGLCYGTFFRGKLVSWVTMHR